MVQAMVTEFDLEHGPAPVRALASLGRAEAEAVEDAVRRLAGAWSVERHDDYEGYLSLLVLPDDGRDRPGFLITGRIGSMELAELREDALRPLGRFGAVAELIGALHQRSGTG